jgi:hypothetical protein
MPYSHSLVAVAIQAIAFGALYVAMTRDRRAAIVLGLCVFSHWVLDWIAHAPDMPILHGDAPRYGLGLWNSIPGTLAVEAGMFAAGCALYASRTRARDRIGSIGWWSLAGFLGVAFVSSIFSPPPPSMNAMLNVAFGVSLILPVAWWIDRHREDV